MSGELESDFIAFSPDSPLFGVKANDSVSNTLLLSEFLNSIVTKMKDLCESLKHTAATGNALASQMQGAGIGGSSKYAGCVSPIMKHFGGILSGISSSQEILAECLENAFINPLEEFNTTEVSKISTLQQQYKKEHQMNEDNILRYLQSDITSSFTMTRTMNQALLGMRALDVVVQRKKFELTRFDFVRGVNAVRAQKTFEIAEACINVLFALRSHHRESSERLQSSSSLINGISEQQFEARNKFNLSALPIDSLRSNIMSVMDTMIERVQTQLPQHSPVPAINPSDSFHYGDQMSDFSGLGLVGSDLNVSAAASHAISRLGSIGASFMGGFSGTKAPHSIMTSGSFEQERKLPGNERITAAPAALFLDVELRMKALDRHQLESFYAPHSLEEYSGLIKQGYLLERSGAKLLVQHTWSRDWFVLDDSKLYIIKEKERDTGSSLDVQIVCETMLASVRELKSSELPFVFEISYANRSSHVLQAEGHREYEAWVGAIRQAIERRLVGDSSNISSLSRNADPSSCSSQAASEALIKRQENAGVVKELLENNRMCAECERPDPDWVSLNLGCLICIDCSGVHRSLGVHISKVRSLTLDDLDVEEYAMLNRIGNSTANSIWEAVVPPLGPKKPRPYDLHPIREKFIQAKYVLKSFLAPSPVSTSASSESSEKPPRIHTSDELLRTACENDDIIGVFRAIVYGANVCAAVRSPFVSCPISSSNKISASKKTRSRTPSPFTSSPPPPKTPPPCRGPALTLTPAKPLSETSIETHTSNTGDTEDTSTACAPVSTEWSPLLIAAHSGSCASVALLLLCGADPYHVTSVPDSGPADTIPLIEIAERAGHVRVAAYLHRKLDAMVTPKGIAISSPVAEPVPSPTSVPAPSSSSGSTPLKGITVTESVSDSREIDLTASATPDEEQPTTLISTSPPDAVSSEIGKEILPEIIAPIPVIPSATAVSSHSDADAEEEDDLEDFYEALMKDFPTPKTLP